MEYKAIHRYADMSPRKVRPFAALIRGRSADEGGCGLEAVCPVQGAVAELDRRLREMLRSVSLADLLRRPGQHVTALDAALAADQPLPAQHLEDVGGERPLQAEALGDPPGAAPRAGGAGRKAPAGRNRPCG